MVVGYERVHAPVVRRVLRTAEDSAAERARQLNIRHIIRDDALIARQRRQAEARARAAAALSPGERARREARARRARKQDAATRKHAAYSKTSRQQPAPKSAQKQ